MSFALGGSTAYNTARMDASHERLIVDQGMTMEAFDVTLGHLAASLQDLGVPEARCLHCPCHAHRGNITILDMAQGVLQLQAGEAEAQKLARHVSMHGRGAG